MRGDIPPEREEDGIDFNEVRKTCVENTVRTILDDLKFNPIKPKYRQMLLRPKYTELTVF